MAFDAFFHSFNYRWSIRWSKDILGTQQQCALLTLPSCSLLQSQKWMGLRGTVAGGKMLWYFFEDRIDLMPGGSLS